MNWSRRRLLAAAAGGTVGLSGCLGGGGSSGGADDGDPDGLSLSALDVAGSPGGEVAVRPAGTVALLDFFATWCAPCKPQMEHLREVRGQFPDVHMLSITNEGDADAVRSFWRDYEGTWPVAMDTELRTNTEYGAQQVPTLLVIDAEGSEVWRHVGLAAAGDVAEQLRAAGAGSGG